jgi:hypothetical protein
MIPPNLLLRDTVVAALVLAGAGLFWGVETATAVAAGGAGASLNLWLLIRAVYGAVRGGFGAALLPVKVILAIVIVGGLLVSFPVLPVLAGFSAGLIGLLARGLAGAFFSPTMVESR